MTLEQLIKIAERDLARAEKEKSTMSAEDEKNWRERCQAQADAILNINRK